MILAFQILTVILAGIAAYFLWVDNFDWAFGSFGFAVCSYFFSLRFQVKARVAQRKAALIQDEPEDLQ